MCKYCTIVVQNYSASYRDPASPPRRVFVHVATEEIWTTCWLDDTHSHTHTHARSHTRCFRKLLLFVNEANGAEARDKNMCRHAKNKVITRTSIHARSPLCSLLTHIGNGWLMYYTYKNTHTHTRTHSGLICRLASGRRRELRGRGCEEGLLS